MSSRLPPLLDAWIGNHVTHRSLNLTPQRRIEHAVAMREKHCLEILEEAIEEGTKPKFGYGIQILERLNTAQIDGAELAVVVKRLGKIAPLNSESVYHRLVTFLGLSPNLQR